MSKKQRHILWLAPRNDDVKANQLWFINCGAQAFSVCSRDTDRLELKKLDPFLDQWNIHLLQHPGVPLHL